MKQPDLTITPLTPPGGLPTLSRSPWSNSPGLLPSPFIAAQIAQSDMLSEAPRSSGSTKRYSRRHLSYEDVRCVHVEESSIAGNDDMYIFRVRPNALKMGSWRGSKTSRRMRIGKDTDHSDEEATLAENDDNDKEGQDQLPSYMIKRSASEILEISNRLLNSFETLLEEKRGGPYPLSREVFQSRRNVKDFFRRRKKQVNAHEEAEESLSSLYKIALVNEFFTKAIQTGGEVVSSSRAMQDFFDQCASFKKVSNDVLETVPVLKLPKNKPILSDLLIGEHSPASEASNKLNTPASWRSLSPFTPNSAQLSNRDQNPSQGRKTAIDLQGKTSSSLRGKISHPIIPTPVMSPQPQRQHLTIHTRDETILPRTPRDKDVVRIHSVGSQDIESTYGDWREELSPAKTNKRDSRDSSSSFVSPHSAASDSDVSPFGQLKQVSGVAVKTKAIGWKFAKGAYNPNFLLSKKVSTPSSDGSPLRPLLTHQFGSQVSLPCSTLSAPADGTEMNSYKPSALERLIFGNEGRHLVTTSTTTSSEEEDYFGPNALDASTDDVGFKSHGESKSSSVKSPRVSTEVLASPSSDSDRGEKSAYRNKGKASDLYLDLKGRSNLHTESMPDPDTIALGANKSAFSFDDDDVEGDEEDGEMQEIELSRGPVSMSSPVLTPISQQLAAIQKEAENMALFHRQEYSQIESSRSASRADGDSHRGGLILEPSPEEGRQLSAMEGEAQVRQAIQSRKLLSPS